MRLGPGRRRAAHGAPHAAPHPQQRRRQRVSAEDRQQHRGWMDGDEHEEQRHEQHVEELDAPVEIELLEARIAEAAHHQGSGARGNDKRRDQPDQSRFAPLAEEPHERRHDRRRRRARQPLEVALVGAGGARVEARQPQRRRHRIEEAGEPAETPPEMPVLRDAHHAPLVGDDGRREPEGHHVGETVVFLAEEALGARQARNAPVERVEDHGRKHRHARLIKVLVDGCHDRVEAREQAGRGEEIRQQVDALAAGSCVVLWVARHDGNLNRGLLLRCQRPHLISKHAPMRLSQYPVNTMKETPAEAEVVSHQLMLRAGLIRRLAAGLYSWLPLGLRVLQKVERIIREEMNRAGALELVMPVVQPAELWQESGRWTEYGPELLRIKDRHERDFVAGPTHEEVITDIARRELQSYRQLPVNFYQIQTKFRDEVRPRFGVMRAREFIMKDAYSFHIDQASLQAGYRAMYDAYTRIFTRTGLTFRAVRADSGAIGGGLPPELHALAAPAA